MDRTTVKTIKGMPFEWQSGKPETPCGNGSKFEETEIIREFIQYMIETYSVKTIADIGCGDQNWIHECLPDVVDYTGFDIMPRRHDVLPFDCTTQVLPEAFDMVLCVYVLNHVPPSFAERALRLIAESGSGYLMMSYSDSDEYALPGELIKSVHHKRTPRHSWRYGLWKL
jgi:hypothetical protein